MNEKLGAWLDILSESIGKYISLETFDGIHREGKISGYKFRYFYFNRIKISVPTEIELNGDEHDRIPIDRVATMEIS